MTTEAPVVDTTVVPPAATTVAPVVAAPEVTPVVKEAAPAWEASGDTFVDTIANDYLAKGGTTEQFLAMLDDVSNTGVMTATAKTELLAKFGPMANALIPTIEQKAKDNLTWVTNERNAIYNAVGGEAAFRQIQNWAATNLDAGTREFLTSSLQQGGKSAQLALNQLKDHMIAAGETVTGTTHKVDGVPTTGSGYIGLAEYISEHAKLQKTGDTSGIASLKARANSSMAHAEKQGKRWR